MTRSDGYGWCHSWQCVAEWTWGSNASNVATLFGVIATFIAAYVALRISRGDSLRRRKEDEMRARLAAIANHHVVADALERVKAWHSDLATLTKADGWERTRMTMHKAVALFDTELRPVDNEAQALLAALPGNAAFHIARGFANIQHLRERRASLESLCNAATDYERLRVALVDVLLTLERAIRDLSFAKDTLSKAAAF
jgi:hypothetical protein